MEPIFKTVCYDDEWALITDERTLGNPYLYSTYALGWRIQATAREFELIRANQMFGHCAVTLLPRDPNHKARSFTFAEVLGPELIPEVNQANEQLIKVSVQIREAAATWNLFFENMR